MFTVNPMKILVETVVGVVDVVTLKKVQEVVKEVQVLGNELCACFFGVIDYTMIQDVSYCLILSLMESFGKKIQEGARS